MLGLVGGDEAGRDIAQPLRRDVLDVGLATAQAFDPARVDVDPDHVVSGLGERDRQRQADIAEADDPDFHGPEMVRAPELGLVATPSGAKALTLAAAPGSRYKGVFMEPAPRCARPRI